MSPGRAGAIDVVIPTFNGFELLERCLHTLASQTVEHRTIVVDNGSGDGTPERLRERFPGVALVSLQENAGFARAVNAGIRAGEAEQVVLVNNDVELDADFLERLVEPLAAHARVGSVAGLLLVPERREVDSYGIEVDRTLSAFPRFAGAPYPETALHERNLAGPSGGAAAYRRAALDEVGGFDEGFFAYMEDVDLALRLRAAGWQAAGARDAIGVHLGSASFGLRSRWQVETAGASRAYLLRKYGLLSRGAAAALQTLAVELGVLALDAAQARDLAAARGRLAGWSAGAGRGRANAPGEALNPELGLVEALRRRRAVLMTPGRPSRASD
jgi:N-acetylglucosaminyl-diphospho-decaprenol L-rhamnosyltransferase